MKSSTAMNNKSNSSNSDSQGTSSNDSSSDSKTEQTSVLVGPKPIDMKTTSSNTNIVLPSTTKLPFSLVNPARHENDVMKSLFSNFTSKLTDDDGLSAMSSLLPDLDDDLLKDFTWTGPAPLSTTSLFSRDEDNNNDIDDLSNMDWLSKSGSLPDLSNVLDLYSGSVPKAPNSTTTSGMLGGHCVPSSSIKVQPIMSGRQNNECLQYQDEIIDLFGHHNHAQQGWLTS